jgi:hypothetical protein
MVPMPKIDASQERFYTTLNFANANTIAIPISVGAPDAISLVVEAIMAESRYTLRPAYFDVAMERKLMRDEESVYMLEIILDTRIFDLIMAYNWGELWSSIQNLTRSQSRDFMSLFERLSDRTIAAIEATVTQFEELN